MNTKICKKCNIEKSISSFHRNKKYSDGRQHRCKECCAEYASSYLKTKEGLLSTIYNHQKQRQKKLFNKNIGYSKIELSEWLNGQELFHELFDSWEKSGFDTRNVPSIDRIDDYVGYEFGNIQLMTWEENNRKGKEFRINGINNKVSREVIQMSKSMVEINRFFSTMEAERQTGLDQGNISKCCLGKVKSVGGFIWVYA